MIGAATGFIASGEIFVGLTAAAPGGILVRGTTTFPNDTPGTPSRFYLDKGNGTPDPIFETGAGGIVHSDNGNVMLPPSSYFNWGTVVGSSGYGIWNDAGVMKMKNSGGSWLAPLLKNSDGTADLSSATGNSILGLTKTGGAGATSIEIADGSGSSVFFGTDGAGNAALAALTGKGVTLYANNAAAFSVGSDGASLVSASTATPAAGSTAARLLFGTTAGFGIYYGSGVPTVAAAHGSIYLRSDGTQNNRLYIYNGAGWSTFLTTSFLMMPDRDNKLVPANDNFYAGRMAA